MPGSSKNILLKIYSILLGQYGPQKCFLDHSNPFELLVCAILSAQCTDKMVNKISPQLFKKFPDAASLMQAKISEVETIIKSIGLYKNKAKNIVLCAKIIREKYHGQVPSDMNLLTELPGVGRKTANVVLGNAFGIPAFPVDTHVLRVMERIGFVKGRNPEKVERFVNENMPKEKLTEFSHLIIQHGRNRCQARKPDCKNCEIRRYCATFISKKKKRK